MSVGKKIEKVPVCFNVLDPDQAAMLEWVRAKLNRSGYLKRLIQRDMDATTSMTTVSDYTLVKSVRPVAKEMEFEAAAFV